MNQRPWAAFCISTFKRPGFLKQQLTLLLQQTFEDFEIVISDNDPLASAKEVSLGFGDSRIKYFHNGANLGMICSFNKSIERATATYIVMVTDDDPIEKSFLHEMRELEQKFPDYSLYGGFVRRDAAANSVELIKASDFIAEILDPRRTPWMLWSSVIIRRTAAMDINLIPDYGSPHLADHALIAMAGSVQGGVVVNKKYSSLTSHDSNYSKFNFDYYIKGCEGFYYKLLDFSQSKNMKSSHYSVIIKHLEDWFIGNTFNLKRYYSVVKPDSASLVKLNEFVKEVLLLPFMKHVTLRFHKKNLIFILKKKLGFLN